MQETLCTQGHSRYPQRQSMWHFICSLKRRESVYCTLSENSYVAVRDLDLLVEFPCRIICELATTRHQTLVWFYHSILIRPGRVIFPSTIKTNCHLRISASSARLCFTEDSNPSTEGRVRLPRPLLPPPDSRPTTTYVRFQREPPTSHESSWAPITSRFSPRYIRT